MARVAGLSPRLLAVVFLAAPAAYAQTLEILGPAGLVSPDGFGVALMRRGPDGNPVPLKSPALSADGADLRPFVPFPPLQTFLVLPRQDVREVRIRASDANGRVEQRFPVGPPGAKVELALDPPAPVKGRDTRATLTVRLLKPDGTPDPESAPPVLKANVGKLEALESAGPGLYRASYVLPQTRYPEVAIVVAFAPWPIPDSVHGTFGRLFVPLATSIDLPGRTEPNAQMSINIAGVQYGPVQAGADGRFLLPVIVPPGYRYGEGLAVDRLGNKRRRKIDLMLPPTDQLACVMNPSRLPANGKSRARVLCATSDPYGKPVASAQVRLEAQKGSVHAPRAVETGILEWLYTAPKTQTFEPDLLNASWRSGGEASREELRVGLEQGPATSVEVEAPELIVHRGGELPVKLTVRDALDRLRPKAIVEQSATAGELRELVEVSPGKFRESFAPPASGGGDEAELSFRVYGPAGSGPALLWAWARDGHLHASLADQAGLPLPDERLRVDDRVVTTGPDGSVDLGPATPGKVFIRHDEWPGLKVTVYVFDPKRVFPYGPPEGSGVARLAVALAPPIPVNVRLEVHGRDVTYWVEDPKGRLLPERPVEVTLSGGQRGPLQQHEGRTTFQVQAAGPVTVAVADAQTGVTAMAEVRP